MTRENRQVWIYASGARDFLLDGERRFAVIDTDALLAGASAHELVQRWRDDPRNVAIRDAWEQKTDAEVADDVRAMLAKVSPGQDPPYLWFVRSRPDDFDPALFRATVPQKVPPVVAHAPPARRGRWARG